jgi:signal transduction histidine kinase
MSSSTLTDRRGGSDNAACFRARDRAPASVHYALALPGRLEAPSSARKALTALNGPVYLLGAAELRDVQLLVSELVANAVRHGGRADAPVSLVVRASPRRLRVEVSDRGGGFDCDGLRPVGRARSQWGDGDCRSSLRWPTAGAWTAVT